MDPSVASFVPSRGRQQSNDTLSSNALVAGTSHLANQEASSSTLSSNAEWYSHARSTSSNGPKSHDSRTKSGNHSRSRSVPGSAGADFRGRGGSRGGRGGSRGRGRGAALTAVHRTVKKPSPPDLHLDSIQDFPVLGGTDGFQAASSSLHNDTNGQRSPTSETVERRKSLSFARAVAPTPPPDSNKLSNPIHSSSSSNTASSSISVSSMNSFKPDSTDTSPPASEKIASSPPTSNSPERPSRRETPIIQLQEEGQRTQRSKPSSPFPPPPSGLTPVQLAFIAANNLSVEGLPTVSDASTSMQTTSALQQIQPVLPGAGKPRSIPYKTNGNTDGIRKDQKRPSRRQQERHTLEYNAYWSRYAPQIPYTEPVLENGFSRSTYGRDASNLPDYTGTSSFHFSADAPSFTPGSYQGPANVNVTQESSNFAKSNDNVRDINSTPREDTVQVEEEANEVEGHIQINGEVLSLRAESHQELCQELPSEAENGLQAELSSGALRRETGAVVHNQVTPLDKPSEAPLDFQQSFNDNSEQNSKSSIPKENETSDESVVATSSENNMEWEQESTDSPSASKHFVSLPAISENASEMPSEASKATVASILEIDLSDKEGSPFEPYPDQYSDGAFKEPIIPNGPRKTMNENTLGCQPDPIQLHRDERTARRLSSHSSFSLLPPISVEDFLGKAHDRSARDGRDEGKETYEEGVDNNEGEPAQERDDGNAPTEPVEGELTTTETKVAGKTATAATTDSGIDKDFSSDGLYPTSRGPFEPNDAEASTHSTEYNIPSHPQDSSISHLSEDLDCSEVPQQSLSPGEVEKALLFPLNSVASQKALKVELEQASQEPDKSTPLTSPENLRPGSSLFTGSSVPQPVLASNTGAVKANGFMEEASDVVGEVPTFQIISSSDELCVSSSAEGQLYPSHENVPMQSAPSRNRDQGILPLAEYSAGSESNQPKRSRLPFDGIGAISRTAADSQEPSSPSDAEENSRHVRSSAPSPSSMASNLPSIVTTEATPSETTFAASASAIPQALLPSSAVLSSPDPLFSPMILPETTTERPSLNQRVPSQAEKEEAVRIIAEMRSEPSSPAAADTLVTMVSDTAGSNQPLTSSEISEDLPYNQSVKRKRGVSEEDREMENKGEDKREKKKPNQGEAPSLTLTILSGSILPRKQLVWSVLASLGINLFLPFVNGVMLGFGEIFARDWLGPFFGLTVRNKPNNIGTSGRQATYNTSNLGLRNAGNRRGGAQDVPGHPAAKTAIQVLTEEAVKSTA